MVIAFSSSSWRVAVWLAHGCWSGGLSGYTTQMEGDAISTKRSVMSELDRTGQLINSYFFRLEGLERSLKYKPMTNAEREAAEKDVAELKKILLREENRLQSLRKNNRSSAVVAVVLIFASFLIFGLYKMYTNIPKEGSGAPTRLEW
ncbi:hypothetical protein Fcan01_22557 [Folsomia candida]|uniref:Coiled-coil domain-containing protein 167 n=1 Tax=Folsomia candida TaxID=158441 RepID=A0A226DDI4_FOLCA|nr:hypothetical protein Fcan01_22557 [Folsomia candida]